jgi:hypothetical protein
MQYQFPPAVKYRPIFTRNLSTLVAHISEFILISLLFPNSGAKFGRFFTQWIINSLCFDTVHYQILLHTLLFVQNGFQFL